VVLETGLAALAERWLLVTSANPDGEIVCILEASPEGVTVAVGYSSFVGGPTPHVLRADIERGQVTLRRCD
jgi:hypothetical protein